MLLCKVMGVTVQGFYAWRRRPVSRRAKRDEELRKKIVMFHCGSRMTYGSPRIQAELRAAGERVSRKRVARLMREAGLRARCKRKFLVTTRANSKRPVMANVMGGDFRALRPDTKWAGDITYVPTQEGWLYLAVVMDMYSRKVVGWAMGERITDDLTVSAMVMALKQRIGAAGKLSGTGLVFHSDRGSQYASSKFQGQLQKYRITHSMSGKGNCYDNAVVESFFASLKAEEVKPQGRHGYISRGVAQRAIFSYIEGFYNRVRRHSALGYVSPVDFERMAEHTGGQVA